MKENIISKMINAQKSFAGSEGGRVIVAPFRTFSCSADLLKQYLKNMIGSAFGAPLVASGAKAAAMALNLTLSGGLGIGIRMQVSTPRDTALELIEFTYTPKSGLAHVLKILPGNHENAEFYFFSAKSANNEVYPVFEDGPSISILDGKIPDGSVVTIYDLDLADDEVRSAIEFFTKAKEEEEEKENE